ncbi:hypothetical protein [Mucilaginibacter dorajii]|uniref:Uncharacterized protein n=1 Tax=Mucilaginibacter dorajii TaxID=692994 RepID=A0ABP7Q6U9_9SPHI|nr:hypothetical protein [Mucilaginibacter dorajii]MCS3737825.1 hypothetical protein [Mucilaginibacter dorajii]
MKKVLIITLLAACAGQLKAQTLQQSVWGNKSYWSPYMKPKANGGLLKLDSLKPILIQPTPNNNFKSNPEIVAIPMAYNMPIVKVSSDDRMPIVKTDEPGMHYDMLIKRLGTAKRDSTVKIVP